MYLTLYANEKGELFDYPGKGMLGQTGQEWVVPEENEMILLPKGASLVTVPENIPVSIDSKGRITCFDVDPINSGQKAYAVARLSFRRVLPVHYYQPVLAAIIRLIFLCWVMQRLDLRMKRYMLQQ